MTNSNRNRGCGTLAGWGALLGGIVAILTYFHNYLNTSTPNSHINDEEIPVVREIPDSNTSTPNLHINDEEIPVVAEIPDSNSSTSNSHINDDLMSIADNALKKKDATNAYYLNKRIRFNIILKPDFINKEEGIGNHIYDIRFIKEFKHPNSQDDDNRVELITSCDFSTEFKTKLLKINDEIFPNKSKEIVLEGELIEIGVYKFIGEIYLKFINCKII